MRGVPTTRRGLIAGALGLVSRPREPADSALAPNDAGGGSGEVRYRSYREGVADLRRLEQAAPPPPPPQAVRTWREGAAAVAAGERSSG